MKIKKLFSKIRNFLLDKIKDKGEIEKNKLEIEKALRRFREKREKLHKLV